MLVILNAFQKGLLKEAITSFIPHKITFGLHRNNHKNQEKSHEGRYHEVCFLQGSQGCDGYD